MSRQPDPPAFPYGRNKNLPTTAGLPSHPDTFLGPRNKVYIDFQVRRMIRLRGVNAWYYVRTKHTRRIDGDRPLANNPATDGDPFRPTAHDGGPEWGALYGEPSRVLERLDSTSREIQSDWVFKDPLLVRGRLYDTEHSEEPDERGAIYVRNAMLELPRRACEVEWTLQPQPGDILRFQGRLNAYSPRLDDYMEVEEVERDSTRYGASGFFALYVLRLRKSSTYDPSRKLPSNQLTDNPPSPGTSPGALPPETSP